MLLFIRGVREDKRGGVQERQEEYFFSWVEGGEEGF